MTPSPHDHTTGAASVGFFPGRAGVPLPTPDAGMDELCGEFADLFPRLDFDPAVEIPAFAAARGRPEFSPDGLLARLVALDFERRYRAGRLRAAEDYIRAYPGLVASSAIAEAVKDREGEVAAARWVESSTRCRIEDEAHLGRGSFGEALRATQILDDQTTRTVVLKRLRGEYSADAARRIRTEYRAYRRVDSPHVVTLYDVLLRNDQPTLVLQYCDGGTLQAHVERCRPNPATAAGLVRQVAEGVRALHRVGVAHRDLKPDNVFLMADRRALVGDLGLARIATEPQGPRTEGVFGAPGYLAPEVLARRDGGPDPDYYRADLFALGAVLYFAVYHRPPFGPTSDAHAQLTQRDRGPVYERRRADQSLGAINHICRACLYPDPALRYSLDDLIAGLDGFLFGGPIPRWREPWHRWVIRVHHSRPFRAVAVDLAVVLGIVAALGWTAYSRDLAQLAEQGIGVADGRVREAEGTFRPALISRAGNRRAWDEAEMARDEAARRVDRFDPVARWVWAGQSRQQVDQLTSIIHTGRSAAEADYALIENLDAILSAMIGRRTEDQNQAQLIDEFQTVLARHLDTYGVRLEDEDKLAEHVAGSRVWADLLAGIDALALLRKKVRPVDAEGWRRLLRAANRADPVVWRHDFRTLNLAGKAESDIRQHISGLRTVPPDEHPQLTVYLLFSLARDDESRAGLRAALLGLVDRHRADFWLNYALAMCSVKDRAEAIGYFRVARSKREDPILLANLAEALLAEGSSAGTAEGTEILRSLCLRPDASPEARNNFGVALMRANQLSQAKEQFSLAIAEMQRRYHRKFPAAFVNLASYHERAGENIVAAQLVTQVIEDPTASNECRALAYMIRATAQIRFHERSTVRGFTYLASDLPILPAVTGAPRIGLLLEGVTRQRLDRAEEDARLGVTLAPHLASPRQTLGWVLSYCGQRDKALDELLRATTLAPRDARVWYGLGEFYATHGYDAEALRVCHHCIVLDPNMWEPHFWCGKILCNRVDKPVHELRLDAWAALLPEARLHLRAAQRMAPESAEIAACLNVVYYVLGESHEAARQDLLARKLNQENPNLEQREAVNRVIRTVNTARRIDEIVRKYIAGDLDPRIDPDRYAAVAQLEGQRRYWIMSRVYHRLLQDNPRPIPRHLLEAARACALAADGEASDRPTPSNQERKSLQVELLFYGRRALDIFRSADNPANRSILRTLAQEWLSEWALAPYGSSGNLRRPLDADQRTAFEAFWREMARYAAPN